MAGKRKSYVPERWVTIFTKNGKVDDHELSCNEELARACLRDWVAMGRMFGDDNGGWVYKEETEDSA